MSDEPFYFAIPFRSKKASRDWEMNQNLLRATLRSIFSQTDPNFHVLLACHEVPDIPEVRDPRVILLQAKTPPPSDLRQQMEDKGHKKRMMSVELRQRGGGYFMLTDSDDLVSCNLVEYARANGSKNGYVIKEGYIYDARTKTCRLLHSFDERCGTCAVFRFAPDDLPRSLDDSVPRLSGEFKNHRFFEEAAARIGRPLTAVPFPAAMYVTGHGENHSSQVSENKARSGFTVSENKARLKALLSKLENTVRSRPVPERVASEFTFSEQNYL